MANSIEQNTQFDIAIVGGGMAGATAAICFAQLGFNIALVEAVEPQSDQSASFDGRAVALSASSVNIFNSLGLWQLIKSIACPIHTIHVSDRGNPGISRLDVKDYSVEALGQVITLEQVGPLVWQAIAKQPGISRFCPAVVESFEQDDSACQLNINQHDQTYTLTAKLVIAADGTFSKMAAASDIKVERKPYQQHAVIANIQTQKNHNHQAFERFTEQGPIALLPLARNKLGLVWCQTAENSQATLELDDESFCHALQKAFGYRLGKIQKVSRRSNYPLSLHLAETHYRGRVLLMGNAAHTLHPIAGQGFNLGLRDIAALNDCLISAINDQQDIGSQQVLDKYVQSRTKDWQQTVFATDSLNRLFINDFLPLVVARNKAMSWLNLLPFAKRQLADTAMGFNLKSSRLARGLKNQIMVKEVI